MQLVLSNCWEVWIEKCWPQFDAASCRLLQSPSFLQFAPQRPIHLHPTTHKIKSGTEIHNHMRVEKNKTCRKKGISSMGKETLSRPTSANNEYVKLHMEWGRASHKSSYIPSNIFASHIFQQHFLIAAFMRNAANCRSYMILNPGYLQCQIFLYLQIFGLWQSIW